MIQGRKRSWEKVRRKQYNLARVVCMHAKSTKLRLEMTSGTDFPGTIAHRTEM